MRCPPNVFREPCGVPHAYWEKVYDLYPKGILWVNTGGFGRLRPTASQAYDSHVTHPSPTTRPLASTT